MANYSATGHVVTIGDVRVFSEKFSKRDFVLEIDDGKYPQTVEFQCCNDKAQLLDTVTAGDRVTVDFNLRGRQWTSPNGDVRYFNSLDVWKLEREQAANAIPGDAAPVEQQPMPNDDDLPF